MRIDGDEDAPDARDKRQRAAVGTPGIMGRRIARNGRHRHSHEILSLCLALEVPRNAAKIKWNLTADLFPPFFFMNCGRIAHKCFCFFALFSGCESTETKTLPTRETNDSELPWGRPAWEGGLPEIGDIGD